MFSDHYFNRAKYSFTFIWWTWQNPSNTVPIRRNLTANANGYRMDTEWVRERKQNVYRTDIERIRNGNKGKSVRYQRTHSSEHMLVSYAISCYHSVHQRFENDTILNTHSSKFCPARQSWEKDRTFTFLHWWCWKCLTSSLRCTCTSCPRAITDYLSLCIISEKDSVTGLEVTVHKILNYNLLPVFFKLTGLIFSPHQCKFIVCFHTRTHKAKV